MRETKNEEMEYADGVRTGSMLSQVLKQNGRDVLMNDGIVLWSRVIGSRVGGQERLGRARRDGKRARGPFDTGVIINLS
jgi:hypothetical protein